MDHYRATIAWVRNGAAFTDHRYSRSHHWYFDGGVKVPASASPEVVPVPLSNAAAVDPEEAFVASLSSCHMLWFLSIAASHGFVVEDYRDTAEGVLDEDESGRTAITEVTLRPEVSYLNSAAPEAREDTELHEKAHDNCFIAHSVRTVVHVEPTIIKVDAEP
ncbi:OsmC family protein [Fodinibius sediminis]|uniref:Organic hydroperoxide reductase OsmC/OhrA n=1 Tax=Fodinibius sediminis TaxID=1214077 RepID=A0A521BF74_9BACT|nr:OsmC family protein [Fodinibius sediminis]SMO45733.1 Organic hydroperoxide reductase OsmC/OhrA [Fodinibius sediminis]